MFDSGIEVLNTDCVGLRFSHRVADSKFNCEKTRKGDEVIFSKPFYSLFFPNRIHEYNNTLHIIYREFMRFEERRQIIVISESIVNFSNL